MSDRVGGIVSFVVDGVQYEVEGSFTFSIQAFTRESVIALTGRAGHKRTGVSGFFEGTCFLKEDVSLTTLGDLEGITAQLDLYNRKKFVLQDADQVGELNPDAGEGTFTLRLEGTAAPELSTV